MRKISVLSLVAVAGLATTAAARPAYVGGGFAIPDNNAAGNSSTIVVPDAFSITDMSVTITWPATTGGAAGGHTWCGDLVATLTGPGGTVTIMNRIGSTTATGVGDSSDFTNSYTFSDSSVNNIWTAAATAGSTAPVANGTYEAHTRTGAFAYQRVAMLGTFGGTGSLGNWTLKITDGAGGDTGTVASWTLNLTPTPGAASLFGLAGLAGLRRRR